MRIKYCEFEFITLYVWFFHHLRNIHNQGFNVHIIRNEMSETLTSWAELQKIKSNLLNTLCLCGEMKYRIDLKLRYKIYAWMPKKKTKPKTPKNFVHFLPRVSIFCLRIINKIFNRWIIIHQLQCTLTRFIS